MATITQRQLRNESASIMDRVEAGEGFTVTRSGRPVAKIMPISGKRTFIPMDELVAAFADLPPIDYEKLRAEADEFFADGGDRVD